MVSTWTPGPIVVVSVIERMYAPFAAVTAPLVDLALALLIVFALFGYYGRTPPWQIVFLPVFVLLAGVSGRSLAFGPGHLTGSARPGEPGNCVISAHRDTQFAFLRQLEVGDVLDLETPDGSRHRYRVFDPIPVLVEDEGEVCPRAGGRKAQKNGQEEG